MKEALALLKLCNEKWKCFNGNNHSLVAYDDNLILRLYIQENRSNFHYWQNVRIHPEDLEKSVERVIKEIEVLLSKVT